MVAPQLSPKMESLYGLGRQATTLKGLYEFCKICKALIWKIFR